MGLDLTTMRRESDEDLLALLLEIGRDVADPQTTVHMALREAGGLGGLPDCPAESTTISQALQVAREVTRRLSLARAARSAIRRPEDVAAVAMGELDGADRETLLLLVCDAGNRLLRVVIVTEGSADRLLIPVRETMTLVLQHRGRGFAVAHNHPSGDATPSHADLAGTRALAAAAKAVGLRFLGHVIVADDSWQAVDSGEVGEGRIDG